MQSTPAKIEGKRRQYLQYGCGLSAPVEWTNYDISPTLRLQKIPVLGKLLRDKAKVKFPENVLYGDIIRGLPVPDGSCDGVYCSHTLEHLALDDFRKALANTHKILKKGGIFRCVVPDLETAARSYLKSLEQGDAEASSTFMRNTRLGIRVRPKGLTAQLKTIFGNAHHLWMWDGISLASELEKAGFRYVRICRFNDSEDEMFRYVEDVWRFHNSVAVEGKK